MSARGSVGQALSGGGLSLPKRASYLLHENNVPQQESSLWTHFLRYTQSFSCSSRGRERGNEEDGPCAGLLSPDANLENFPLLSVESD